MTNIETNDKRKHCPHCGAPLPEEATFCPSCMTKLLQEEVLKPPKNRRLSVKWKILTAIAIVLLLILGAVFGYAIARKTKPEDNSPAGVFENSLMAAQKELHYQKQIPIKAVTAFSDTSESSYKPIDGVDTGVSIDALEGIKAEVWFNREGTNFYIRVMHVDEADKTAVCQLIEMIFTAFTRESPDASFLTFLKSNTDFKNKLMLEDTTEGRTLNGTFNNHACQWKVIPSVYPGADGAGWSYDFLLTAQKKD